jgi:hypothetical protein
MSFEIIGEITDIEIIAVGSSIRDLPRLRKMYGKGRWRKLKGNARIKLKNGRLRLAELHWYEAHEIGRKELKRKRKNQLHNSRSASITLTIRLH